MADDDRPTWFLSVSGRPTPATGGKPDKAPPAWTCREGDAAWTRVENDKVKETR